METSVSQVSNIVKSAYLSFFSDGYNHEHNDDGTIPRPGRRKSRCRVHIDRRHIRNGMQIYSLRLTRRPYAYFLHYPYR